jgi:hypothetical protein
MPQYYVKVRVDLEYEVEANSVEEAEEQGWKWEDYTMFSEVYSINVEEMAEEVYEDEDEDGETED